MSALREIAPRLARAHEAALVDDMRHLSRCYHGGWHSRGAGPCFETIDAARAFRDRETARLAAWCDARAKEVSHYDFDANRWVTWAEQWDIQGWPDGRQRPAATGIGERA